MDDLPDFHLMEEDISELPLKGQALELEEYTLLQGLDGTVSSLNHRWLAQDGEKNRYLVKQFSGQPETFSSASRAIRALQNKHFPNTLLLPETIMEEEQLFITPYVNATNLYERMKSGPLTLEEAVQSLIPIAGALDFIHRHGFIHRDVSPKNILLERTCAGTVPRLTDFDLLIEMEEYKKLAIEGKSDKSAIGTPLYMAPEVILCLPADGRADLYGLAVIAFECLTGQHPFFDRNPYRAYLLHCNAPVPAASSVRPGLPHEVDSIFFTALAKKPEERFQSGKQFMENLAHAKGYFSLSATLRQTQRLASLLLRNIPLLGQKLPPMREYAGGTKTLPPNGSNGGYRPLAF